MRADVPELEAFAREVREAGFTSAVLLGMGGSSLAPEVLRRSIADARASGGIRRLLVLDTTDPATILGGAGRRSTWRARCSSCRRSPAARSRSRRCSRTSTIW